MAPACFFSEAQQSAIVLKFGELKSPTLVRRWFKKQYPHIPHRDVPHVKVFMRVLERFQATNTTHHAKGTGRPTVRTEELIETVRGLILNDCSISISEIALQVEVTSDVGTEARFARSNLYFSQSIQTATMVALTRQPSVSPPRTGWSPPRPAPTSG